MPPQVEAPEATERPTKLSIASTTIAMPISSVSSVISRGVTLGSTSVSRMRGADRPSILADVT